jgi:hypothetical protein
MTLGEAPHLIDKVSQNRKHVTSVDASRSMCHTLVPSSKLEDRRDTIRYAKA